MRWLWIDTFTEFESGKSAQAVKNLSLAEDHFREHFAEYPVMPGSLILEGLAQTGGILVGEANQFQEKVVLAKISSAKFFREATPGERLVYDVQLTELRAEGASISGKVTSDGHLVAEAEIMFAHLDQSRSKELFGDQNFVFSGELKNLLGLSSITGAKQSA